MTGQVAEYDTPRFPTPTIWLHFIALACALIPLGMGTLVFVLYLFLKFDGLALIGLLTIFVGTGMAFLGLTCAGVYVYQAQRAAAEVRARARRRAVFDVLAILANFPIAFCMAWAGTYLMSLVTVRISNQDVALAENVRVVTQMVTRDLGTIAPGATRSTTISDQDFGKLSCTFIQGGVMTDIVVRDFIDEDEIPPGNTISLSIRNGEVKED